MLDRLLYKRELLAALKKALPMIDNEQLSAVGAKFHHIDKKSVTERLKRTNGGHISDRHQVDVVFAATRQQAGHSAGLSAGLITGTLSATVVTALIPGGSVRAAARRTVPAGSSNLVRDVRKGAFHMCRLSRSRPSVLEVQDTPPSPVRELGPARFGAHQVWVDYTPDNPAI